MHVWFNFLEKNHPVSCLCSMGTDPMSVRHGLASVTIPKSQWLNSATFAFHSLGLLTRTVSLPPQPCTVSWGRNSTPLPGISGVWQMRLISSSHSHSCLPAIGSEMACHLLPANVTWGEVCWERVPHSEMGDIWKKEPLFFLSDHNADCHLVTWGGLILEERYKQRWLGGKKERNWILNGTLELLC